MEMYRFYHDEDGYITSYDTVDENGESKMFEVAKSKRRMI